MQRSLQLLTENKVRTGAEYRPRITAHWYRTEILLKIGVKHEQFTQILFIYHSNNMSIHIPQADNLLSFSNCTTLIHPIISDTFDYNS